MSYRTLLRVLRAPHINFLSPGSHLLQVKPPTLPRLNSPSLGEPSSPATMPPHQEHQTHPSTLAFLKNEAEGGGEGREEPFTETPVPDPDSIPIPIPLTTPITPASPTTLSMASCQMQLGKFIEGWMSTDTSWELLNVSSEIEISSSILPPPIHNHHQNDMLTHFEFITQQNLKLRSCEKLSIEELKMRIQHAFS